MSIKTTHVTKGLFPITGICFTEVKWKETRLQKTFIIVFKYLTLDHCRSQKSSQKEGVVSTFPYRRSPLPRRVLVLSHDSYSAAGLSIAIISCKSQSSSVPRPPPASYSLNSQFQNSLHISGLSYTMSIWRLAFGGFFSLNVFLAVFV